MPQPLRIATTTLAAVNVPPTLGNGFSHEESQSPVESLRKRAHAAADAGDPLLFELWTKYGDVQQTIAAYRAAGRTELPALPVKRDVKVIAHRALRFEDDGGSFYVAPWMHPQTIPERFLNHPYFQSAKQSGLVEVISEVPSQAKAKEEGTRG